MTSTDERVTSTEMRPDVSIVLYRPSTEEVYAIASLWTSLRDEIRTVRLLISAAQWETLPESLLLRMSDPLFDVIERSDNIGFASGHNLLLKRAFAHGADSVIVANPDIQIEPDAITSLSVRAAQSGRNALYAPLLERLGEDFTRTGLTDSEGIRWDAWGRHFDRRQGDSLPKRDGEIALSDGVTGACMLVFKVAYDQITRSSGYFFDDTFLAYREDAELGIRASNVGIQSRIVYVGGFGHVRTVRGAARGNTLPDLLGVKNRFLVKYALGRARPGRGIFPEVRDVVVIVGTIFLERSSLPGLQAARRIRRFVRFRGRLARNQP